MNVEIECKESSEAEVELDEESVELVELVEALDWVAEGCVEGVVELGLVCIHTKDK